MKIGSIKEDIAYEKRVSITPDSAKNLIELGLEICIEKIMPHIWESKIKTLRI